MLLFQTLNSIDTWYYPRHIIFIIRIAEVVFSQRYDDRIIIRSWRPSAFVTAPPLQPNKCRPCSTPPQEFEKCLALQLRACRQRAWYLCTPPAVVRLYVHLQKSHRWRPRAKPFRCHSQRRAVIAGFPNFTITLHLLHCARAIRLVSAECVVVVFTVNHGPYHRIARTSVKYVVLSSVVDEQRLHRIPTLCTVAWNTIRL